MGVNNPLSHMPHLPGSKSFRHSFYRLRWTGRVVTIDAASDVFQFAAYTTADLLRGNHTPALIQCAIFLICFQSMYGWNVVVYMDGIENEDKGPENQ